MKSTKGRGCLLGYSQTEPGRELTQPSPRLLAEPCTLRLWNLCSFPLSAIVHFELAQDAVAGDRPARRPPHRVPDAQRAHVLRVRGHLGLHAVAEPHVAHHGQRQETEQDYSQHESGAKWFVVINDAMKLGAWCNPQSLSLFLTKGLPNIQPHPGILRGRGCSGQKSPCHGQRARDAGPAAPATDLRAAGPAHEPISVSTAVIQHADAGHASHSQRRVICQLVIPTWYATMLIKICVAFELPESSSVLHIGLYNMYSIFHHLPRTADKLNLYAMFPLVTHERVHALFIQGTSEKGTSSFPVYCYDSNVSLFIHIVCVLKFSTSLPLHKKSSEISATRYTFYCITIIVQSGEKSCPIFC